jgi:hypothetical protein
VSGDVPAVALGRVRGNRPVSQDVPVGLPQLTEGTLDLAQHMTVFDAAQRVLAEGVGPLLGVIEDFAATVAPHLIDPRVTRDDETPTPELGAVGVWHASLERACCGLLQQIVDLVPGSAEAAQVSAQRRLDLRPGVREAAGNRRRGAAWSQRPAIRIRKDRYASLHHDPRAPSRCGSASTS